MIAGTTQATRATEKMTQSTSKNDQPAKKWVAGIVSGVVFFGVCGIIGQWADRPPSPEDLARRRAMDRQMIRLCFQGVERVDNPIDRITEFNRCQRMQHDAWDTEAREAGDGR